MNRIPLPRLTNFFLLISLAFNGCAKPPKTRPAAGDVVVPVVICPKSWQAGGPVILCVKLSVQHTSEAQPVFLRHEDVPIEPLLRATFTFSKGDAVLATVKDVPVVPEC